MRASLDKNNAIFINRIWQATPWFHKTLFQFLHEHLGISSALLVFFAARGRQIVGRAFAEAAFGLKISERLGGEREQFGEVQFLRLVLDELDQFAPDALIFVRRS